MNYREALNNLDIVGDHWRRKYVKKYNVIPEHIRKQHFAKTKELAKMVAKDEISFIDAAHHVRAFPTF